MKKLGLCLLPFIIFFSLFILLNRLVQPKYKTDLIEGSLVSDYYDSLKDHEVILFGDCEIYANFSPLEMYREEGIKAFNRAGSQQMLWQSYYLLEETLHYETPKVIVLSVGAIRNGKEMINEAYNRLNIDGMKWSKEKVSMIKTSMREEEHFLSYVFPLLRYHDRIFSLTKEDFTYLFKKKKVSYNGFILNKKIEPVGNLPTKRPKRSASFDEKNIEYLDKFVELCKEKGIELVLVKAPSLYPYWYEVEDTYMKEYASNKEIQYINLLEKSEEMKLDFSKDTYDGGLHLNYYGALKNSIYFSKWLKSQYDLGGYKNDKKYNALLAEYDKKIESEK